MVEACRLIVEAVGTVTVAVAEVIDNYFAV